MPPVSLSDFSSQYFKPTADQKLAIAALDLFFTGSDKVFLLKGYAGTGKTTLLKLLAAFVQSTDSTVVLMAPTGRAARIMMEKTGFPATTIHRGIYNNQELNEIEIKKDGKIQYKFHYNLKQKDGNIQTVYLVDEASMISDKYQDDDFFIFGSGILLKDLLDHVAPGNLARRDKLIFIGDDAQLPPVSDSISGALDSQYLFDKYGFAANEYQLTEVIRQAKESGILENATRLRELIKLPGQQLFRPSTGFPDVHESASNLLVQQFCDANPDLDTTTGIVLVSKNKIALDHNLAIRSHYFPGKPYVQQGEILLVNQNNYNYETELLNGMLLKVIAADEIVETKSNMKSYDANGNDCTVTHHFRWVTILVPEANGESIPVRCMILDSFLNNPERALLYSENIALYIDFKLRHPHLKPHTDAFTKAFVKDPYVNALKVKYGYAITVYKAQGGEWGHVLVDMDHYLGRSSKSFLRWTYTAITRASKKLVLFNMPSVSLYQKLEYRDQRLPLNTVTGGQPTLSAKKVLLRFPPGYQDHIKDWFADAPAFILDKFHTLLAQLQDTRIMISGRKKLQFAEEYTFSFESRKTFLSFYYNGKNQFTRTLVTPGKPQDQELLQELLILTGTSVDYVISDETDTTQPVGNNVVEQEKGYPFFSEQQPSLKTLYNDLNELVKERGVSISNVLHKQYLEQYYFSRGAEAAMVQFWYNGQYEFTTATPYLAGCNSNELLGDVFEVVEIMLVENKI